MAFHDGFVSQLVGRTAVIDRDGARTSVGRVVDFVVEHPEDTFLGSTRLRSRRATAASSRRSPT